MTKFAKPFFAIILAISSVGCTTTQATKPQKVVTNPKVLAECALLKEAMARSASVTGSQNTQIVIGCPGYENVKDNSNRFSGAGSFISAASSKVPQAALDQGRMGKILFQRMISRGVTPTVATEMVTEPVFRQAVAAYG